jgi:hypothetical protein
MFAMRPALDHHKLRMPAEKPGILAAPNDIAARLAIRDAIASPDFAPRVAQARRDARLHPALAAMLLISWMSDRG